MSGGVEWALHCCLNLAWTGGEQAVPAARLAAFYDLPTAYLNKQMQALAREGIVSSVPGPRGGFERRGLRHASRGARRIVHEAMAREVDKRVAVPIDRGVSLRRRRIPYADLAAAAREHLRPRAADQPRPDDADARHRPIRSFGRNIVTGAHAVHSASTANSGTVALSTAE